MVKAYNNVPSIKSGTNKQLQLYLEAICNNQDVQIENASQNLREEIIKRFERAIAMLYRKDRFLLEHKMNEVNVCGRLAIYLQKQFKDFKGYFVDIEYYMLSVTPEEYQGGNTGRIRIDIILHSRGNNGSRADILMAVEAKYKAKRNTGNYDKRRLQELTALYSPNSPTDAVHSTLVGVFIRFNESECKMTFFSSGNRNEEKEYKVKNRTHKQ
jgi:hypothetical protein